MSLHSYFQKRNFKKSPEPLPHRFVVQKHAARRLHYDFRIEVNGVLKSWAVPKGPSLNPDDKRLAMMTEDHPLEYRTFEGTIPKGNYGAGEVIVWDEGTYEVKNVDEMHPKGISHFVVGTDQVQHDKIGIDDLIEEKLEKGHLSVVLYGKKLKGEFSLIRGRGMEENAWFLIKKDDVYASGEDVTKLDYSVLSHTLSFPRRRESRSGGDFNKRVDSWFAARNDIDGAKQSEMLHDIKPMLATAVDEPFDKKDWLFELKWDGYRGVAEVENGKVKLYSRNHKDFSVKFSPIVDALQNLQYNCVLDGEIAVLDEHGRAGFQYIQQYQDKGFGHLVYIVFDLLYLDGYDLRDVPLTKRKQFLKSILPQSDRLRYSDHIEEKGEAFFVLAKQQGVEGIIAKEKNSTYKEGIRSKQWLKIKARHQEEAIICGYTQPRGGRKYFGALILGIYKNNKLTYIGHTGTGFDDRTLKSVKEIVDRYKVKESPFEDAPSPNAPVQWIKPNIMCEVGFTEWTEDGVMRHPVFLGIREDKLSKEETEKSVIAKSHSINSGDEAIQSTTRLPRSFFARNDDNKLKLTNLSKVYFPKDGITKEDVIAYYKNIAEVMLPYVVDRPQSLNRFPDGIEGKSFYHKDLLDHPDWVKTVPIFSSFDSAQDKKEKIHYFVCEDTESLLYAANLGCIEINVWNSRLQQLEKPDYLVIDLDPENIGFDKVIDTAFVVRDVLEKADIPSFPKTSGATGFHIYIPMGAQYSHEIVRRFAEVIAHMVHDKSKDFTSIMRSPTRRKGKVYIDFLQNRQGQTMAAPYSIRPRVGAPVSTPLRWEEVTQRLTPDQFTMKNMLKRVEKVGDVWKGLFEQTTDIQKGLRNLQKE